MDLPACLKALGREAFILACTQAGRSKQDAEKLADDLRAP